MTQAQFNRRMDGFVDATYEIAKARGEHVTREATARAVKKQLWEELKQNLREKFRIFGRG